MQTVTPELEDFIKQAQLEGQRLAIDSLHNVFEVKDQERARFELAVLRECALYIISNTILNYGLGTHCLPQGQWSWDASRAFSYEKIVAERLTTEVRLQLEMYKDGGDKMKELSHDGGNKESTNVRELHKTSETIEET